MMDSSATLRAETAFLMVADISFLYRPVVLAECVRSRVSRYACLLSSPTNKDFCSPISRPNPTPTQLNGSDPAFFSSFW